MAIQHPVRAQTLGLGGDHILLVDLIEEAVLGQQGHGGKVADYQSGNGQDQVPEVVEDLASGAELIEVIRGQPAQREPIQVASTGEQDDQQNSEQKRRNRIADDDCRTGPDIEMAAVAGGFGDAQRDRHQVHDQRAPQPQGDRHRHLLDDQVDNLGITKETVAKIQVGVVLDHDPQTFRRRLVEAIHLFDFFDQGRVQALSAAVVGAGYRHFGTTTGDTAGGAFEALELGDHLLDRAARSGLDDDEVDDQDAEQRRNDQQQTAKDIGQHTSAPLRLAQCLASVARQARRPA
ncbi:hypothetical protein D3C81_1164050 [compost metagenome]